MYHQFYFFSCNFHSFLGVEVCPNWSSHTLVHHAHLYLVIISESVTDIYVCVCVCVCYRFNRLINTYEDCNPTFDVTEWPR